ncbi:MAG: glycoside hydrolase family 2 TIM barrel-domain containing protein, partial [Eubacteriales bacterium]
MHIPFNNDWLFHEQYETSMNDSSYSTNHMQLISIPHSCVTTPYHYFDETIYQMVSGYRKSFLTSKEWKDSRVFLKFDGVLHSSHVYLNGHLMGSHQCGYTSFTIELTDHLHFDAENILVVSVDSRESNNIPPFGNVIDYMTYGGIYREVSLEIKSPTFIEDVFVQTTKVIQIEKELTIDITLNAVQADLTCSYSLAPNNKEAPIYELLGTSSITAQCTTITSIVKDVVLWSIDEPNLYYLRIELFKSGHLLETKEIRFGFREVSFQNDGFYLNGNLLKLIGLNRHQSYPYVGYAMPKRPQQLDADILKNELSLNAVRTSHYPQSQHFIDRCDEIGLLVFTEIVGWQHIDDEAWKKVALQTTRDMVLQYRNHPSIMIWGVRINESQDDDAFYHETNRIAHELDPSRATGGVRYLTKSNLLEDVYTFNDFSHTGNNEGTQPKDKVTSNYGKPYLITEYNGHMFPTKAFDDESHRLEHALRHANVLQGILKDNDIAGGFGWCMFDYNTHKDFGSGDRICYHGVLTMFRNHKLAASVYASQTDKTPFLAINSSMNIGEYPGGNLSDVYAFTNADSVRLYKNHLFVKEFYPDLPNYSA